MNAKKTPLQQVNEDHGGKAKLVDKVLGLIERGEEEAGELKARLQKASNKKLLRMAAVSSTIKEKYGSPDKLAAVVAHKLNRAKAADFLKKLEAHTPAKLLDMVRSLSGERRRPLKVAAIAAARPAPEKKAKPAAKKPAAKKPGAKAPAKKPAAKKPAK